MHVGNVQPMFKLTYVCTVLSCVLTFYLSNSLKLHIVCMFSESHHMWCFIISTSLARVLEVLVILQYEYNILVITQVRDEAEDAGNN